MKRILTVAAVLMLSIAAISAQGVTEPQDDETLIKVTAVSSDENGTYMIEAIRQDGERVIYIAAEGETESDTPLADIVDGDYLLMKDKGIATMSLPPQIPASALRDVTDAVKAGLISFAPALPTVQPGIVISIGDVSKEDLDSAFSYSYGYLSMQQLITQNLYPRGGYFARGLLDAAEFDSIEPLVAVEEMSSVLQEFMTTVYNAGLPTDYGDIIADEETIRALGAPESLEDRFGYSYGYVTFINLLYGGVAVDAADFAAGILTSLYGADPIFTEEEMIDFINDYIAKLEEDYRAWLDQISRENLEEAEAFLSDNATNPAVTVLPSGVQIEYTYDDTTGGMSPSADDTVTVDYTLTLLDGTVMDQGNGAVFSLSSLIPGFSEAVQQMTVGDSIRAYIPPELGYGEYGTQTIEPNSLLIFDITLSGIEGHGEDEPLTASYSYDGYSLSALIEEGRATLSYPASISDEDAEAFIGAENAKYGFDAMGVTYSLEGDGTAVFTYPSSIAPEDVKAELDLLVEDLIDYIS